MKEMILYVNNYKMWAIINIGGYDFRIPMYEPDEYAVGDYVEVEFEDEP